MMTGSSVKPRGVGERLPAMTERRKATYQMTEPSSSSISVTERLLRVSMAIITE